MPYGDIVYTIDVHSKNIMDMENNSTARVWLDTMIEKYTKYNRDRVTIEETKDEILNQSSNIDELEAALHYGADPNRIQRGAALHKSGYYFTSYGSRAIELFIDYGRDVHSFKDYNFYKLKTNISSDKTDYFKPKAYFSDLGYCIEQNSTKAVNIIIKKVGLYDDCIVKRDLMENIDYNPIAMAIDYDKIHMAFLFSKQKFNLFWSSDNQALKIAEKFCIQIKNTDETKLLADVWKRLISSNDYINQRAESILKKTPKDINSDVYNLLLQISRGEKSKQSTEHLIKDALDSEKIKRIKTKATMKGDRNTNKQDANDDRLKLHLEILKDLPDNLSRIIKIIDFGWDDALSYLAKVDNLDLNVEINPGTFTGHMVIARLNWNMLETYLNVGGDVIFDGYHQKSKDYKAEEDSDGVLYKSLAHFFTQHILSSSRFTNQKYKTKKNLDILAKIMKKMPDINYTDKEGDSILHTICSKNGVSELHTKIGYMLDLGIDPRILNNKGMSAMDCLEIASKDEISQKLILNKCIELDRQEISDGINQELTQRKENTNTSRKNKI